MTPEERKAAADLYKRTGWRASSRASPSVSSAPKSEPETNNHAQRFSMKFSMKPLNSKAEWFLLAAAVFGLAGAMEAENYLLGFGAIAVGVFVFLSPTRPQARRGRRYPGDHRYDGYGDSDGDFGGE